VQLILYIHSVCFAVSKPSHPLVSCHAATARRYGIALPCRNLYPGFFISNIHANNRADGNVGYRGKHSADGDGNARASWRGLLSGPGGP
jgi:hypothetical protein